MKRILVIIILISSCNKFVNNLSIINKNINDDLILASVNGNIEQVTALLSTDVNLNYKDKNGSTALICACENGSIEIVKLLIEKKASIDYIDSWGKTALMHACARGNIKIVRFLIKKGANINCKGSFGSTALTYASYKGHAEIVKLLLEKGADANDGDKDGWTALMLAAKYGYIEIAKLLIDSKIEINCKNKNNQTVLRIISEILTHKHNKSNNLNENNMKDKLLYIAILLIESGAQEDNKDVGLINKIIDYSKNLRTYLYKHNISSLKLELLLNLLNDTNLLEKCIKKDKIKAIKDKILDIKINIIKKLINVKCPNENLKDILRMEKNNINSLIHEIVCEGIYN